MLFALSPAKSLPSNRTDEAPIRPIILATRVVPPKPGKRPTRISGNPIFDLFDPEKNLRWQARPISVPIPAHIPLPANATGLLLKVSSIFPNSIFLRSLWPSIMYSKILDAGLGPELRFNPSSVERSIPPEKSALPEVIIIPFILSSDKASITNFWKLFKPPSVIVFIDFSRQSHVINAMLSLSTSLVKSLHIIFLTKLFQLLLKRPCRKRHTAS